MEAPGDVAARIKASGVRRSLVAALDDWAFETPNEERANWCLEIANLADPDLDDWRRRARDPKVWRDKMAVVELAKATPVASPPGTLVVALSERLAHHGGDATEYLKRIQVEHPANFLVNFLMANALVRRGNPQEAIAYYRAALAARPDAAVASNNLAVALRAAGRLDEAIAYYERALRLNPGYAPAHNNLGLVLRDQGRLDEAQSSFELALKADPSFFHAHMNLGNILRRQGEVARAIECYQHAARISPADAKPLYSLGLIMAEHGQFDDAIKNYQSALQLEPRLFQAHCNLGRLLTEQGRLDEAIHHLKAAISIEPGDSRSHKHLGRALQQKGDSNQALIHLFESYYLKKQCLAAAKLCADTLTAHPKLADDLKTSHRYRAARAAALAGSGQGADVSDVVEAERAHWRNQAREWLRLDLAAWRKRLEDGGPDDRAELQRTLDGWKHNTDLAGLRDANSLERLSATERQECQALWQEVAELLRRAQSSK